MTPLTNHIVTITVPAPAVREIRHQAYMNYADVAEEVEPKQDEPTGREALHAKLLEQAAVVEQLGWDDRPEERDTEFTVDLDTHRKLARDAASWAAEAFEGGGVTPEGLRQLAGTLEALEAYEAAVTRAEGEG